MWFLIRCFISCSNIPRYSTSRADAAATARACAASCWRAVIASAAAEANISEITPSSRLP